MHDLLTKAVEAGARAISIAAYGQDLPDPIAPYNSRSKVGTCMRDAEAALRAALPGILEAVVGVARAELQTSIEMRNAARKAGDTASAVIHATSAEEDARIIAAQRALVAQILEDGK